MNDLLNSIIRKPCWYVAAGGCTGSVFKLYLGDKIPREKPVENDRLGEQARLYEPEYDIMVYCAWRLDGPDGPITSWLEPNEIDGSMVNGLNKLTGESVERIQIFLPVGDMEVEFSGGKTMKIFCDATAATDRTSNWFVHGPNGFSVDAKSGSVSFNYKT